MENKSRIINLDMLKHQIDCKEKVNISVGTINIMWNGLFLFELRKVVNSNDKK